MGHIISRSSPIFSGVRVADFLVFCVVFGRLLLVLSSFFSFGHCVVCLSSIYGFWFTPLVSSSSSCIILCDFLFQMTCNVKDGKI
jgi:hypothetical protein